MTRRASGIKLHRVRNLKPEHVTLVDGIPCTTVERTIFDCASCLNREALKSMLDAAQVRRCLDERMLLQLLASGNGSKGTGVLRDLLAEGGVGENITRSFLEESFSAICRAEELPQPLINASFELEGGYVYPDFFWPDLLAVVETDDVLGHSSPEDLRRDHSRTRRLERAGVVLTRFARREVVGEPEQVGRELLSFLGQARLTVHARRPLAEGRLTLIPDGEGAGP